MEFGIFFTVAAEHSNGQLNAAAYLPFSILPAVLMAAVIVISATGTLFRVPHLVKADRLETGSVAPFLFLFKYRISRSRHEATLAELAARRSSALAESISPGSTDTPEREAGRARITNREGHRA